MPTYYEMLKMEPTATVAEIEAAIETNYNQWRRLVTHHDPSVVNQANQSLQTLEQIRATLTDPTKRAVYDTAIGLGGPTGGLADPEAVLRMAGPAPTPPAPLRHPVSTMPTASSTPGLWACPKCGAENPAQTKHCLKCGARLVRECPECKKVSSLIATGFCGECGYKYDIAQQRADLGKKINGLREEAEFSDRKLQATEMTKHRIGCLGFVAGAVGFLGVGSLMFTFINFIFRAIINDNYSSSILPGIVGLVFSGIALLVYVGYRSVRSQQQTYAYDLIQKLERQKKELKELERQYAELMIKKDAA